MTIKFYTNFLVLMLLQYCITFRFQHLWSFMKKQKMAKLCLIWHCQYRQLEQLFKILSRFVFSCFAPTPSSMTIRWQVWWKGDGHFEDCIHRDINLWESKISEDFISLSPTSTSKLLHTFLIGCIAVQCIVSDVSVKYLLKNSYWKITPAGNDDVTKQSLFSLAEVLE